MRNSSKNGPWHKSRGHKHDISIPLESVIFVGGRPTYTYSSTYKLIYAFSQNGSPDWAKDY